MQRIDVDFGRKRDLWIGAKGSRATGCFAVFQASHAPFGQIVESHHSNGGSLSGDALVRSRDTSVAPPR